MIAASDFKKTLDGRALLLDKNRIIVKLDLAGNCETDEIFYAARSLPKSSGRR
jgi:hypothetical protein